MFVTGAGRLRDSRKRSLEVKGIHGRLRRGACPANNKYSAVLEMQKNTAIFNDIFLFYCALYILYDPTI